jgi:antitoxin (DNA-binding transcriptional repressor) of toxin-antitoxin stability system
MVTKLEAVVIIESVNVAKLKASLSAYLQKVKQGKR